MTRQICKFVVAIAIRRGGPNHTGAVFWRPASETLIECDSPTGHRYLAFGVLVPRDGSAALVDKRTRDDICIGQLDPEDAVAVAIAVTA